MRSNDDAMQPDCPPGPLADVNADKPRPSPFDRAFNTDVHRQAKAAPVALLALAVLPMIGWAAAAYRDGRIIPRLDPHGDDEAALQRKVAAALPLGSTKGQVEAWLKGQGVRYCELAEAETTGRSASEAFSFTPTGSERAGQARMEFDFDDDGRLKEEIVLYLHRFTVTLRQPRIPCKTELSCEHATAVRFGCWSRTPRPPRGNSHVASSRGRALSARHRRPALRAAADPDLTAYLARPILGDRWTVHEVVALTEAKVPSVPAFKDAAEWEKYAARLRADILDRIVYRGEAAAWRDARTKVEWQETIPGGDGYRIKKLRYEALPGMWVPALLYEPEKLSGKVPVVLNVNGHDPVGKAAKYKQIRCINQAKRGMIALNVEWFGMGQLRTDGFVHERMNQIDLCGSSGLAPFYLAMKRGLDVLLSQEHADPERVAVTGLSGGGWQTIFISALDTRVTLTDPVAGYSSFKTRARHVKDLGDPEQTPTDLATLADYTHLTAMMAPRPTLLTFNANDNCCFEAGYALPPLLHAAEPVFRLYGKEKNLRYHVSHVPGTHAYEKDNREAFYRMVGDFFYPGDAHYDPREIPCDDEIKTKEQLGRRDCRPTTWTSTRWRCG